MHKCLSEKAEWEGVIPYRTRATPRPINAAVSAAKSPMLETVAESEPEKGEQSRKDFKE